MNVAAVERDVLLPTPKRVEVPVREAVVDLTVAIVNYKSKELLARCLDTWRDATRGIFAELCIVENGTGDRLEEILAQKVPGARLAELPRSIAFSAAVNTALLEARGRYVCLLNPDTLLGSDSLARLVRFLDSNADVGVVGPRVWDDAAQTSIQRSWRAFPSLSTAVFNRHSLLSKLWPGNPWTRKYLNLDAPADATQDTDWLSGCCMVVRTALFQELRGLDTGFPMFCEDVDFCRRVKAAGHRVVYLPQAEIVHHVGGSRKKASMRSEWLRHRSMSHYVLKYRGRKNPVSWALVAGVWGRFVVKALHARSRG